MNQAHATISTDEELPGILRQMLTDIEDHQCAYWLYTNYYDLMPPTSRMNTRWWMSPLYVDYDALWNPEFLPDTMLCDVILKNELPAQKERIRIEYAQIYAIARVHFDEGPKSQTDCLVYSNSARRQMPPIHT